GPTLRFRARGLSLKVRLVLLVLAGLLPPIFVLTVLYIQNTKSLLEDEFESRGELAANAIEAWLVAGDNAAHPETVQIEVDRLVAAKTGVTRIAVFLLRDGGLVPVAWTRERDTVQPRAEERD